MAIYVGGDRVTRFSRAYPIDSGPSLEAVSLAEFEFDDETTLIVVHPGPFSDGDSCTGGGR